MAWQAGAAVESELREAHEQAEQLRAELAQARQQGQETAAREQGLATEARAARDREAAAEVRGWVDKCVRCWRWCGVLVWGGKSWTD